MGNACMHDIYSSCPTQMGGGRIRGRVSIGSHVRPNTMADAILFSSKGERRKAR